MFRPSTSGDPVLSVNARSPLTQSGVMLKSTPWGLASAPVGFHIEPSVEPPPTRRVSGPLLFWRIWSASATNTGLVAVYGGWPMKCGTPLYSIEIPANDSGSRKPPRDRAVTRARTSGLKRFPAAAWARGMLASSAARDDFAVAGADPSAVISAARAA